MYTYTNTATTIVTDAWNNWNYQYMLTATTNNVTGGTNWISWNTNYQEGVQTLPQAELTAEQQERREQADRVMAQRAAELREEAAERTRVATTARERAEELLTEMLSDEQRNTREQFGWFAVRGSASGRTYRIAGGTVNNVSRLSEDGTVRDRVLCAHPPDIPDADCHLAQMLLLVTDEEAFVRVSNHHGVAGYDAVLPENREAYRAERQAERERQTLRDAAVTVEGVNMHPVVVGVDVFPDAYALDVEGPGADTWRDAYIPPHVEQPLMFTYNMGMENVVHAYVPGEEIQYQEIREALDPRYAPDHR